MEEIQYDEVAGGAVDILRHYFQQPLSTEEAGPNLERRVDRALLALGRVNGARLVEVRRMALQLQMARLLGLRGPALAPVLQPLLPQGTFDLLAQMSPGAPEAEPAQQG